MLLYAPNYHLFLHNVLATVFFFSSQGGLQEIAKSIGLGDTVEVRLCRACQEQKGGAIGI